METTLPASVIDDENDQTATDAFDEEAEKYFWETLALEEESAAPLLKKFKYAHEHAGVEAAQREASKNWMCNSRYMAKSVEWFPDHFAPGETPSTADLLCLFYICHLGKEKALRVYKEWREYTLMPWQVRERVDTLKQRAPRSPSFTIDTAKVNVDHENVTVRPLLFNELEDASVAVQPEQMYRVTFKVANAQVDTDV